MKTIDVIFATIMTALMITLTFLLGAIYGEKTAGPKYQQKYIEENGFCVKAKSSGIEFIKCYILTEGMNDT